MRLSRLWQDSDFAILAALALIAVLLHTLTNGQYGFHRDELATLDDARYLAWGYVAYPGTGSVSWGGSSTGCLKNRDKSRLCLPAVLANASVERN